MRRLFMTIDPATLERYTQQKKLSREKRPLEIIRGIDILRRALQSLPPRELYMLYAVKVLKVEQDDVSDLFHVRQSNISYRLERAIYRIKLHAQLNDLCSETTLRKALYAVGLPEDSVSAVLGVAKTTSQSATADALCVTQGSVRHKFFTAVTKLREQKDTIPNGEAVYKYLSTIEANYNQLRSIQMQSRWDWKVGDTNYLTKSKKK